MATVETRRGARWKLPGVLLLVLGLAQIAVAVFLLLRHGDPHSWAEESLWFPFVVGGVGVLELIGGFLLLGRGAAEDRTSPATFLRPDEEEKVVAAIGRFEQRTSGELRVHLERHIEGDILEAGKKLFEQLGLTATRERNGVMFLVALSEHRFAVLGDQGIDQKVPPGFWNEVVARVQKRFAQGAFADGLVEGVELAGEQLAMHFPPRADDKNELPDHISRSPH